MLGNYITDEILIKWCTEAKVDFYKIMYKIKHAPLGRNKLYIYTSTPGWLIGKQGSLLEKYKAEFEKEVSGKIKIEFVETCRIMTAEEWDDFIISRGF